MNGSSFSYLLPPKETIEFYAAREHGDGAIIEVTNTTGARPDSPKLWVENLAIALPIYKGI
jgi:hypothetical protein